MMNKKGFTTIELVVSFGLLAVILASLLGFTIQYRDRVRNEEIISSLYDYKNTITMLLYDDVVSGKIKRAEYCTGMSDCINFIDNLGEVHPLKIITNTASSNRGVFLNYDGIDYMLPDSDLYQARAVEGKLEEMFATNFTLFELENYDDSIYNLKIRYKHFTIGEEFEISITII